MRYAIIFAFIILLFPKTVSAVAVTTSNIPSSITDQSFTFNVSITGAGAGTNYIRLDLYQNGTSNYFGETYSGMSWYGDSDGKQYLPITIVSGQTWSGTLQGRLGSPTIGAYPGPGAYKLKVRRYTSSGNAASSDTQTPTDIQINYSAPSPTPLSSPSPSSDTTSSTSSNSGFLISNVPSELNSDQSFTVNISINLSSYPNTIFYLKGAFKKPDSSNYFGETKVSGNWVNNGSSSTDQYRINTDSSGNWSGNLEVKPDILDSGYDGAGTYIFKVGKYTDAGSLTWSNEINLQIAAKEVLTHEPNNSPEVSATKLASEQNQIYSLDNYRKIASVAGVKTEQTPSPSVTIANQKFKNPLLIIGSILLLFGITSVCYIIYRRWKNI